MEWQVKRLLAKNPELKIIGVVGSIGKTSTKLSIARALKLRHSVQFQEGNYNTDVTVPLVFFGQSNPSRLMSPKAWLKILLQNEKQLSRKYPYEFVVIELGTASPGRIKEFGRYLQLDIVVVTAITPEHMEFFGSLGAVAEEELSALSFSKQALINADLCDKKYVATFEQESLRFGTSDRLDYKISVNESKKQFSIRSKNKSLYTKTYDVLQLPRLYTLAATAAVLELSGFTPAETEEALDQAGSARTPGRLSLLEGYNSSTILDDSYNASPAAMRFALDILYASKAPQKIAILGSMNELGDSSGQEHRLIGEYCNPKQIDELVVIGQMANDYLAPAAKQRNCKVSTFLDPVQAGHYVKGRIKKGAFILAKGSQGGVFAEEAVKQILANPEDASRLVRQSPDWLKKKEKLTIHA